MYGIFTWSQLSQGGFIMRVNPVNVMLCQPNRTHNKQASRPNYSNSRPVTDTVSFEGKTAGLLGLLGTAAGIGLGTLATLATGGLAAPLILGATGCAAGCIGGSTIESNQRAKKESNS